jgi:hypothetical protein
MRKTLSNGARAVQYGLALVALVLVASLLPGDSVNVNTVGALVLLAGLGLVAAALQPFARHATPNKGGRYSGRG